MLFFGLVLLELWLNREIWYVFFCLISFLCSSHSLLSWVCDIKKQRVCILHLYMNIIITAEAINAVFCSHRKILHSTAKTISYCLSKKVSHLVLNFFFSLWRSVMVMTVMVMTMMKRKVIEEKTTDKEREREKAKKLSYTATIGSEWTLWIFKWNNIMKKKLAGPLYFTSKKTTLYYCY